MQDQDKNKQLIVELNEMRRKVAEFEAVQKSLSEKESQYRESKQRLELALEGGALGLWDWDVKTGRAIWDAGTTRMMGYEQNELDPNIRTWKRAVHSDDWEKVSEILNGHLSGRLPFYEVEYRMRTKSGEWKWVQVRGKVVEYDKEGKPQRMTGTTLDVTERRQAEEELRKNEEKYRRLVENAYDMVYTTDPNGCLHLFKPRLPTTYSIFSGRTHRQKLPRIHSRGIQRAYQSIL